ncbi:MAG: M48 family metallopeptidase [Sedimenticola sp.]
MGCSTPSTKQIPIPEELTAEEKRAQQILHIERLIDYQVRLEQIGTPLLQAALPFCEDRQTGFLGMRVDNIDAWPSKYQKIARDALKLDHALKVTLVIPESPATAAGLQVGDFLLSINDKAALGGPGATDDFSQLISTAVTESSTESIRLEISRNGEQHKVSITPKLICNYPIHLKMSNTINAYADGQAIAVTSGLIRFTESDEEIALVLCHEIAHNSMKHIEAKTHNASMASVFDIVAAAYGVNTSGLFANMGGHSFSKAFEREADYLGLYILARADYSLAGLDNFWRRMAAENPYSNEDSFFRTHPISADRTLAIRHTIKEIQAKKKTERVLMPELKEKHNASLGTSL